MLPWLSIPLIGLWAFSQLLPPYFRIEVSSSRVACVFVLLITFCWYEILMPRLSAWRERRNALIRERKRFEAIEMQKLRKAATRRCRNCLNPYKDQNPGGGRFMCSYCGHISKRPVLDLPKSPGLVISSTSIVKELIGRSGKILNGKVWSDNGWICDQDWLENGKWVVGTIAGKPSNWGTNRSGFFGGNEHCLTETSYSGILNFTCKLLTSFFLSIRWLWRKTFRVSSSREECSSGSEHRALLAKRCENGASLNESRGEKARRKAEEKRLARLEKELLEEEERKQREEVARLVEERRRLRDEKMEAEKYCSKASLFIREKGGRKGAEYNCQEKGKEKDKGSSKSNSEAEELEKRGGKESEQKRAFDRKSGIDRREYQKSGAESGKGQSTDNAYGRNVTVNNYINTRYLDRMRGTILSSSKAFGFGRGSNTAATLVKENNNSSVDCANSTSGRRDLCLPEHPTAKSNINGDDRNINNTVLPEPQPQTAPKKSWHQLFTRSSSVPKSSISNVICRPNSKTQAEVKKPQLSGQPSITQSFDNPIHIGLPSPSDLSTYPSGSPSSSLGFSSAIEPLFSPVGEAEHDFKHEEPELFEDPRYIPDPLSLLGPVSDSLDNFQLDLGSGFVANMEVERPYPLENISAVSEVNKPSPIECPLSREKHSCANRDPSTPRVQDVGTPLDDAASNEKGTWQMWSTTSFCLEGLDVVGGPESWLLSSQRNVLNKDEYVYPSSQKTMASFFTEDDNLVSSTHSPQSVLFSNGQIGGTFSPANGSNDYDPWLQSALFPPLSGTLKAQEETSQNEVVYGSPSGSASNHMLESSSK